MAKNQIYLEFDFLDENDTELEFDEGYEYDEDEDLFFESESHSENDIYPLFLHREPLEGVNINLHPIPIDFDTNNYDKLSILLVKYNDENENLHWTIAGIYTTRREALKNCKAIVDDEFITDNTPWKNIDHELLSANVYTLDIE